MGKKKLNEQEQLQAVADFARCGNYTEVARKYGVTDKTIKSYVEKNTEYYEKLVENFEQKKEEIAEGIAETIAEDVLTHMQSQLPTVNLIIDKYLKRLLDDDMIAKATPSQVTTALGTLIDKYAMLKNHVGTSIVDDPITKALKDEAERMNNGDFS